MSDNTKTQKEQIAGLYNRVAATYDQIGPTVFSQFGKQVVDLLRISPGAQVLDVAAGRGAHLFPAAEKVAETGRVVGIDLSEAMVKETRAAINRKGLQNISMLQMDAEDLTFDDASFDYVLCSFAYFFFPHLERALSEFFRVLCPRGRLLVTLAGASDERWRWYEELLAVYHDRNNLLLAGPGGGRRLNPSEFKELLTRAGFTDIQSVPLETEAIYADEQEWWSAKWTHGARYPLERMPPEVLEPFALEVKSRLAPFKQSDGFHESWRIVCMLATKPAA